MSMIQVEQLSKAYGAHLALDGLNLEVPRGCLFGFIGPNGAGKTTTIRILLGMLKPTAGTARLMEHSSWGSLDHLRKKIGYLPGDLNLAPWLSASHACQIMSRLHGKSFINERNQLCDLFQLDPHIRVSRMSRGMRQKLGIIMALMHDPALLILDEPTTALDPLTQDLFLDQLRQRAHNGTTVFFSSHVLSEVAELCHEVGIIRRGKLVTRERIDTLRNKTRRLVEITWEEGQEPDKVPPIFTKLQRRDHHWSAELDGTPRQLSQWLGDKAVADFTFSPPDLDRLFRGYYTEDES